MRIVYDASAKDNGPSLNECLYTAPALVQNILDILLRFRCHKVALVRDIEQAFLMLQIREPDWDVQRFLWVDDISNPSPKIVTLRFTRVVFGVSSSPFLLNATVKHHMEQYQSIDPEFVENFLESIYVDDLNAGEENEEQAFLLYKKPKLRLAEGGFNLRKFCSNSPELMNRINESETHLVSNRGDDTDTLSTREKTNREESGTNEEFTMEHDESYTKETTGNLSEPFKKSEQKILGVKWNYEQDCFVFDLKSIAQAARESEATKRNVISISSKFYDPLGFISPIIVQMKLLFQSICDDKLEWDTLLAGELREKWLKIAGDLEKMKPVTLPRCYFVHVKETVIARQLHGFCDASILAYAAVIYLVVTTTTRRYAAFVAAKMRVAPSHKQTIPRLELLSAVILARLMNTTRKALESVLELDERVMCWTDSLVTLYWIKGETKEWKQFVQLRVNEVRSLVPASSWRHCPGVDNPADIPTRTINFSELGESEPWRSGPKWLSEQLQPAEESINDVKSPPEGCLTEMKKSSRHSPTVLLTGVTGKSLKELINVDHFSDYHRLLRVTAYVLRFVRNLRAKAGTAQPCKQSEISWMEEINQAETLWLVEMQVSLLGHPKYDEWKRQFGTFIDPKGIVRCDGRLENANILESAKNPVLLDPSHRITLLIMRHCHERVKHCGVKGTLTELQSRFWIVRGRQFIRKIIHKCVTCRKYEGEPYRAPPAPPLPDCRVKEDFPFANTGVDFAGPLYVKNPDSKVWISLYTCCVTRALHLDLVPDMTTKAFLRNIRRFCPRRGVPSLVISDNAKTFKSATRKLSSLFECPEVMNHFTSSKINWSFILEKAPWWGGFYERMIKSVKRCLRKALGNARLSYEELLTELVEVEATLNSRPLTYTSTEDCEEPVTPSHLMFGRRPLSLPTSDVTNEDEDWEPSSGDITRHKRHLAVLLDHFWRRWKHEYLLELRESHRDRRSPRSTMETIKVNDIVIVHDENHSRGLWRVGRVMCLVRGKDDRVRGANVRVVKDGRKPTTIRRPLQKLYPIEIGDQDAKETEKEENTDLSTVEPSLTEEPVSQRSRRAAATKATDMRRKLIENGPL